jgi:hypothetical protein
MEALRDATIDAFNAFIYELRMDTSRTFVTLTQFDDQSVDMLHDGADVRQVPPLTRATFVPRGMTPLYDAAGEMLNRTEARAPKQGSVLVVFITDGQENASREWDRARIFSRIRELEDKGWAFMYLGAHADSYAEAQRMGIARGNVSQWHGETAPAMAETLGKIAYDHRRKARDVKSLIHEEERRWMEEKQRARRRP